MGENGSRRFGAHLRRLREERRLTLDRIEELSLAYRTRISKSYLSRCETGSTAPNLERLSVLSKIYNTDLGLLIERHEAERELEQLPPIDLTDRTFDDLYAQGVERALHGHLKAAYSIFSAAHDLVVLEGGEETVLRRARARLSLSFVLSQMGKYELACAEATEITRLDGLPPQVMNGALLQVAVAHHRLGRFHMSEIIVQGLEQRLEQLPTKERADVLVLSGSLQYRNGRYADAIKKARQAASYYRKSSDRLGEGGALRNIGRYYLYKGDPPKAIDYLEKGLVILRRLDVKREIAWQLADLARAHIAAGYPARARSLLHESMELARNGEYQDVLFADYFHLWRMSIAEGDVTATATTLRSLNKLLPRVEPTLEEADEFRRLKEEVSR